MDESVGSLSLQMQNYMLVANLALNGSHTITNRNCKTPYAYITHQHFILIIKDIVILVDSKHRIIVISLYRDS